MLVIRCPFTVRCWRNRGGFRRELLAACPRRGDKRQQEPRPGGPPCQPAEDTMPAFGAAQSRCCHGPPTDRAVQRRFRPAKDGGRSVRFTSSANFAYPVQLQSAAILKYARHGGGMGSVDILGSPMARGLPDRENGIRWEGFNDESGGSGFVVGGRPPAKRWPPTLFSCFDSRASTLRC